MRQKVSYMKKKNSVLFRVFPETCRASLIRLPALWTHRLGRYPVPSSKTQLKTWNAFFSKHVFSKRHAPWLEQFLIFYPILTRKMAAFLTCRAVRKRGNARPYSQSRKNSEERRCKKRGNARPYSQSRKIENGCVAGRTAKVRTEFSGYWFCR